MVAGPMTGAWEAMTAAEVNQHRSLKYLPASGWDQYVRDRNNGGRPLTTMGGAQREAFTAGAQRAKRTQALWDTLPTDEPIWELRAGRTSIFRPEENTSELQSLMRISYAAFCFKKKQYQLCIDSISNSTNSN